MAKAFIIKNNTLDMQMSESFGLRSCRSRLAAAEAAVGLAILVVFFRNRGDISVEGVNLMKG